MNHKGLGRVAIALALLPSVLFAGDWAQPLEAGPAPEPAPQGLHLGFDPLKFGSYSELEDTSLILGSVNYQHEFEADFDDLPGDISGDRLSAIIPILPMSAGDWRFVTWLNYRANWLDTSEPSLIPDDTLHTFRLPIVALKDVSNDWIFGGMVMPGLSGDLSDTGDAFSFAAALAVGRNYGSLKLFGGVYYSHGFDDDFVIPGVGFLWRPDNRWSAWLLPPIAGISYRLHEDWYIGLDGRYDGTTWNVESDSSGPDRDIAITGFKVGLRLERRITGKFWASIVGGMAFGRELDIETPSGRNIVDDDIDAAPFIRAGVTMRY